MSEESSERPEPAAPQGLVRLLQEFSLEANRYVDSAGGRNDMHRTDLNALVVIMQHTARNQIVTPGMLGKDLAEYSKETVTMFYKDALAAGYRI